MNIGKRYLRATALFAVFLAGNPVRADEPEAIDQNWLAKAKSEVRSIDEKYSALASRLEEVYEIRADRAPGPVGSSVFRPHTRRERCVRLGDNMLLERVRILDGDEKSPQIRLEVDNGDYHFTLGKSQEDAPYALVNYSPGARKVRLVNQQNGIHPEVFGALHLALSALESDGKSALRSLKFDDSKKLLYIAFTNTAGGALVSHKLYLDPEHEWRIVEHIVQTPSLVGSDRMTYRERVEGVLLPAGFESIIVYHNNGNPPPNIKMSCRVLSVRLTDKTPDDFRLSAFGLPEPVDVTPQAKPTPWYLWILAAAGASGALAVGLSYLHRRRQAWRASAPGAR